jgi:hypothetical protein
MIEVVLHKSAQPGDEKRELERLAGGRALPPSGYRPVLAIDVGVAKEVFSPQQRPTLPKFVHHGFSKGDGTASATGQGWQLSANGRRQITTQAPGLA